MALNKFKVSFGMSDTWIITTSDLLWIGNKCKNTSFAFTQLSSIIKDTIDMNMHRIAIYVILCISLGRTIIFAFVHLLQKYNSSKRIINYSKNDVFACFSRIIIILISPKD